MLRRRISMNLPARGQSSRLPHTHRQADTREPATSAASSSSAAAPINGTLELLLIFDSSENAKFV